MVRAEASTRTPVQKQKRIFCSTEHPELERRYTEYCATLGQTKESVNEQLLFHGCALAGHCDGFSKQCDLATSGCALCGAETYFCDVILS